MSVFNDLPWWFYKAIQGIKILPDKLNPERQLDLRAKLFGNSAKIRLSD
jgi:hypothetical protein